jgi:hypothetical protein
MPAFWGLWRVAQWLIHKVIHSFCGYVSAPKCHRYNFQITKYKNYRQLSGL